MISVETMDEPAVVIEAASGTDKEQEPVLAAALAAVLVEYQRYRKQRHKHGSAADAGANWRMVARLEQLRGQA